MLSSTPTEKATKRTKTGFCFIVGAWIWIAQWIFAEVPSSH